jgi:hypothetical protein
MTDIENGRGTHSPIEIIQFDRSSPEGLTGIAAFYDHLVCQLQAISTISLRNDASSHKFPFFP